MSIAPSFNTRHSEWRGRPSGRPHRPVSRPAAPTSVESSEAFYPRPGWRAVKCRPAAARIVARTSPGFVCTALAGGFAHFLTAPRRVRSEVGSRGVGMVGGGVVPVAGVSNGVLAGASGPAGKAGGRALCPRTLFRDGGLSSRWFSRGPSFLRRGAVRSCLACSALLIGASYPRCRLRSIAWHACASASSFAGFAPH